LEIFVNGDGVHDVNLILLCCSKHVVCIELVISVQLHVESQLIYCHQPKAHYLATSRESRRYVVAFSRCGCRIWLRQESLRHILASHGYAPGTIAVNVTRIEREFNACQMHRSMYPSIFNRLRATARYWLEIATFFYPLAFNAPLGVFPLEFRPQKTRIMGLQGSEDSLTIG